MVNFGSSDVYVQSFTHLKSMPRADKALELLQKTASLVKPIMRKHGWRLPVLAEMYPDNPSLLGLNMNAGEKILLRLRYAHSPDSFCDQESVVGTMLHELTHNVHGPHDDKFYKLLSELEEEYNALRRSGYAGEGFFSEGKRLGTNHSHNVPSYMARQKALEAAERRRSAGQLQGGGRLGGAVPPRLLSPREMAAQAAERRARDQISCASGKAEAENEARKAAGDSIKYDVIDLTGDSDHEDEVVVVEESPRSAGPSKLNSRRSVPSGSQPARNTFSKDIPPFTKEDPNGSWSCVTCTLINGPDSLQCTLCLTLRPIAPSFDGWTCLTCAESGNDPSHWSCKFCGQIKTNS